MDSQNFIITTAQMMAIESQVFAAGMPVAALMEKAAMALTSTILALEIAPAVKTVGVLVGPGHNGGDALVVARELALRGREVWLYVPLGEVKPLTQNHLDYADYLGLPRVESVAGLADCDLIIDGLFGFGLTRLITGELAGAIATLNRMTQTVISIDLPSGIHTDTGAVLGAAIRADYTFCLGLWKRAFFQEQALPFLGQVACLDLGLPPQAIAAVLDEVPIHQRFTQPQFEAVLPLPRAVVSHKYQQGHTLLICGSQQYAGSAILTGLGARASGVGMLTIAVPAALKPLVVAQLPEALVVGCPETPEGAIAALPLDLSRYDAIACGPGLTLGAGEILPQVLAAPVPLVLDADGLNLLGTEVERLRERPAPTILTPHWGEFQRLFPDLEPGDRFVAALAAAAQAGAIVLLKGARTAIASPDGDFWVIPDSTPGLARGGSGDVLTGLLAGLWASAKAPAVEVAAAAAFWHAAAGKRAAAAHTELGVDPLRLAATLGACLA